VTIDLPVTTQAGKLLPHDLQIVSYSLIDSLQFLPGHLILYPGAYFGGCFVKILTAIYVYRSLSYGVPMPYSFTKALEHSL
jgi:hypothetical protein